MPVDLSGSLAQRIQNIRAQAEEADSRGEPRHAAARYIEAAELHEKLAAYSMSPSGHDGERGRAAACRKRARILLERADAEERQGSKGLVCRGRRASDQAAQGSGGRFAHPGEDGRNGTRAGSSGTGSPSSPNADDDVLDTNALRSQILSLISTTTVAWKDIGGLAETKERIQAGVALMTARAPAGVKLPRSRMLLLQGPPGTGKTLLAAAVAGELEATFFNVKASQLMSRYFGDSPRLVSLLFEEARRNSPSIVFLDEFEALAGARTGDESGVERRVLSTLLAELDGVAGKSEESSVLTLAATNTPERLDPAILSRFATQILVPLPDVQARREIWKIHIENAGYTSKVERESLVKRTEGFSGRDIKQLCVLAIESMLLRANPGLVRIGARSRRREEDSRSAARPLQQLTPELKIETLVIEDFDKAFSRLRNAGA